MADTLLGKVKNVFITPQGNINWTGTLTVVGGAVVGTLVPGAPLLGAALGASGAMVGNMVFAPKTEATQADGAHGHAAAGGNGTNHPMDPLGIGKGVAGIATTAASTAVQPVANQAAQNALAGMLGGQTGAHGHGTQGGGHGLGGRGAGHGGGHGHGHG